MLKNALVVVCLFGCGGSPKPQAEARPAQPVAQAAEPAPVETKEEKELREAHAEAAKAVAEAEAARAKVDAIDKQLIDVNAQVDEAIEDLNNIENDPEVQRAKATLEALRKEQAAIKARVAELKAAAEQAERAKRARR